jgi:hypothetical protein
MNEGARIGNEQRYRQGIEYRLDKILEEMKMIADLMKVLSEAKAIPPPKDDYHGEGTA